MKNDNNWCLLPPGDGHVGVHDTVLCSLLLIHLEVSIIKIFLNFKKWMGLDVLGDFLY